ncbi:hypothetical protein IEQ34_004166 [Dendrobium chrysotoxum]|uniref:Uncharacterized protein n=1 Tax=Dendrobium chrysotoxum TaxID=161865 RepID=A0AAV7HHF9_DENCH|nr:hypothetical protein IEQ34_004166 [Dendrobium chrysotoxum]
MRKFLQPGVVGVNGEEKINALDSDKPDVIVLRRIKIGNSNFLMPNHWRFYVLKQHSQEHVSI